MTMAINHCLVRGITEKVYCILVKIVQTEHGRVISEKGGVGGRGTALRQAEELGPKEAARPSARHFVHTRDQNTNMGPTQES